MKKLTTPFGDISNYANLYEAYLSARKGKKSRKDVVAFTANLESNLCEFIRSCRASYRGMLRHCDARALENKLVSRNLL